MLLTINNKIYIVQMQQQWHTYISNIVKQNSSTIKSNYTTTQLLFIWHLHVWLINGINKKWLHELWVLVPPSLHWLSDLDFGPISIKTYLHSIIFFSYAIQCFTKFVDHVSGHLRCESPRHWQLKTNQLIIEFLYFHKTLIFKDWK